MQLTFGHTHIFLRATHILGVPLSRAFREMFVFLGRWVAALSQAIFALPAGWFALATG
jgi:hypothetical protein